MFSTFIKPVLTYIVKIPTINNISTVSGYMSVIGCPSPPYPYRNTRISSKNEFLRFP